MSNFKIMNIDKLVDRFLGWRLPENVRPDPCVLDMNYPYRNQMSGTNLLTATEAKQMLEHVLQPEREFDVESNSASGWMIKYQRAGAALDEANKKIADLEREIALWKNELYSSVPNGVYQYAYSRIAKERK